MLQHAGRRTRGGGGGGRQRHWVRTCVSSDSRWRCIRIRLIAEVVAVVIPTGGVVGQDVQFVHLGAGVHHHQLVLGNVRRRRRQVRDGLGLDALEVHVAAFALLLLPGHADEGPLHVVVDDLRPPAGPPLHLLLVGGVTWRGTDERLEWNCGGNNTGSKHWALKAEPLYGFMEVH